MFDLIAFADKHRYRVRNLHDGRPLHPLRVAVVGRGCSRGYRSEDDRMDAIVCRHGYVSAESDGRIGWYLVAGSAKGINRWLPELVKAGAIVRQEGDREAAGDAPAERIEDVLRVLQPFRKRPQNPNLPGLERVRAPESTQTGRAGSQPHAEPISAATRPRDCS